MTPGQDEPARPGPVGRLLGSLANALLDLGLPTIRQWLRDRIGPAADVAHVTTDGSLVHLDGVRIPIGPHGMLVLERASATITALGRAGLPTIRLHAFEGVLGFGGAAHWFRAEVSFTAAPEPEEAAWIWGELAIRNTTWSERRDTPEAKPMFGRARLFVSSREWRLDGGRLDGEIFRGRFAGSGVFDGAEDVSGPRPSEALLVPAALSTLALSLEHARVGSFLDVVSGVGGKAIEVPSFVPPDAELDGQLSWSVAEGARAELRIVSEAIRATLHGAVGPTGDDLDGHVDAHVRPAPLLRRSRAAREALPREEDVVALDLELGGSLRRPAVNARMRASEIGFRFERPRFVPPVVLRDLVGEASVKDDRAVLRAVARARTAEVIVDVDANVREPSSMRGALRATVLEAAFLRDVARTLGAALVVPDDVSGAVDFVLAPSDVGPVVSGAMVVSSPSSKLELDVAPGGGVRITGSVTAHDAVAAGVFDGAIVPTEGELAVALDVVQEDGAALRGKLASTRLVLALRGRPEVPPFVLEGVTANVALGSDALRYDELRFHAHGGRFVAKGSIPRSPDPARALVDLELEEGGAELAVALAQLANRPATTPPRDDAAHVSMPDHASSEERAAPPIEGLGARLRGAGDGPRPLDEIWLPRELAASGRLRLSGDLSLRADVSLKTPVGTALELGLVLAREGHLDGSTLTGDVALSDLLASGLVGGGWEPRGIVTVDALVGATTARGPVVLVALDSEQIVVTAAEPPLVAVATSVFAALRVDAGGVMWSRLEARLYGGTVASSGVWEREGRRQARVSFSQVAVHELPAIAGREPQHLVRGRLSGSVIARVDGHLVAAGDLMLEDAAFPVLDLVRPVLARYGLRPPNEDAFGPVTATLVGNDWGLALRNVRVDLRGATLRGDLGVSRSRELDGRAEVTLEEAYLRSSKLLTLPRVLADHLVVPIRIDGPLERPRVHARLGESLGRFLEDNRVTAFVTSAVEEAQFLLGHHPIAEGEGSSAAHERLSHGEELDAELREALDAHAADWETIGRRVAARGTTERYRIG